MNSSDTLNVRSGPGHFYHGLPMVLALFGFATALLIDLTSSNVRAIAEGPPLFNGLHLLRTFLVAASSGLFVLSLAKLARKEGLRRSSGNAMRISGSSQVGLAGPAAASLAKDDLVAAVRGRASATTGEVRPARELVPRGIASRNLAPLEPWGFPVRAERFIIWAMMVLSAGMVVVFLLSPGTFYALAKEDHPVEMLSGCLPLLSSALFLFISVTLFKNLHQQKFVGALIAIGFALAFFLIGMEEVSWFQRQLGIETPVSFNENLQKELNLHNFATNEIEILYYFSSFVMLVFLPFSFNLFPYLRANRILKIFVPSPFIVYTGVIISAFNYDMWNMLPTQGAFFASFSILVYYLKYHCREATDKTTNVLMLGLIVVAQGVFIFEGDRFVRIHDVTEYKELLIPIAYLMYTADVIFKSSRASGRSLSDRTAHVPA